MPTRHAIRIGAPGMSRTEVLALIFVLISLFCLAVIASTWWKRGSDRSANIMNLRNCQQAMRGHQGMNSLNTGGPFTRADLESYIAFPKDVNRHVRYTPGDKVTPIGALWLQVTDPGKPGGDYGPEPHAIHDW